MARRPDVRQARQCLHVNDWDDWTSNGWIDELRSSQDYVDVSQVFGMFEHALRNLRITPTP